MLDYKVAYFAGVDVAFNNRITTLMKVSYSRTLDIQYGIYNDGPYKGSLTINCKASYGIKDYIIDALAFPYKTSHGKVHGGFEKEIIHWLPIIMQTLAIFDKQYHWSEHGIILAGRSKGAAEAMLLIEHLAPVAPIHTCFACEPPKICDSRYADYLNGFAVPLFITCYKNDIVPGVPFWFEHPNRVIQVGKRKLGLSIKDHTYSTTHEDIWYNLKEEI